MGKRVLVGGFVVMVGLAVASVAAQNAPAAPAGQGGGRAAAAPTPPCGPNPPADMKNVAKDSRCFELRTYTLTPGGAGDMELLHKRFRDATMALFKQHGLNVVGFWQPVAKPDQLIYLLAFKDNVARDAAWAAFNTDPDWIKARTAMAVTLKVDDVFMIATDYGPMK